MKTKRGLIIFVILALFILNSSYYIVNEGEVAVTKVFSKVKSVVIAGADEEVVLKNLELNNLSGISIIKEKGIHFKLPIIQSVEKYSAKYLTYISNEELINTADNRRLKIQMYAQYRVIDPVRFNAVVGNTSEANSRMDEYVYKTVINSANTLSFNEFFYQNKLQDMLREKKQELNDQLERKLGIYISVIGINRKTFPESNIATIEEKMAKEIEKESAQSIAEGDSEYNQKVAIVDAMKAKVIAKAVEEAAVIKAKADAEAIRTYQEALKVDVNFYRFIERMKIYKNMKDKKVFLDKNSDLLEYLNDTKKVVPSKPIVQPQPTTQVGGQ